MLYVGLPTPSGKCCWEVLHLQNRVSFEPIDHRPEVSAHDHQTVLPPRLLWFLDYPIRAAMSHALVQFVKFQKISWWTLVNTNGRLHNWRNGNLGRCSNSRISELSSLQTNKPIESYFQQINHHTNLKKATKARKKFVERVRDIHGSPYTLIATSSFDSWVKSKFTTCMFEAI